MARGGRDSDLRVTSMRLGPRFMLWNTLALTLVMVVAAFLLSTGATRIARNQRVEALSSAARLSFENKDELWSVEQDGSAMRHQPTGVDRFQVRYGTSSGEMFRARDKETRIRDEFRLLAPPEGAPGRDLLGMIVGILIVVVMVGAGVALWVANQVSRPIQRLVEDVRQIAKGDLKHKTRAVGVGEVQLLARSIDRMTRELETAQEAELELSVREREMDLASGVREALLPLTTPLVEGFDIGALRLSSATLGGDFHDFIEREDGRVGLLVCDVSGQGVPAALVGATARSYLRAELMHADDELAAFRKVNRWLAGDVRRGMFVTALYVLVDPGADRARVVCAGHKLPLLRYAAEDGKLRVVHPEGIALGFDKGPVFDRRLEAIDVPLEPGDRLFLSNSAPVAMVNASGRELGEKAFYSRVQKHAALPVLQSLKALRGDLDQFTGGQIPSDVSLVTLAREA